MRAGGESLNECRRKGGSSSDPFPGAPPCLVSGPLAGELKCVLERGRAEDVDGHLGKD